MLGRHAGQCKITVYAYKVCRHELNLVGLARPSRQLGKTVRYDRLPQRQRIAGNAASVERNRMRNPYQRCLPGGLRRDGPAATAANRGIYCQCGKESDEESVPEMPAGRVAARWTCRNGSESQDILPVWKGDWLGNGHGTAWNTFSTTRSSAPPSQVLLPAMPPRPLPDGADESGISSSPSGIRVRVPLSSGASAGE